MLSIRSVSWLTQSGLLVLNEINLFVQAGEFICIVGPSGSGKTSLLRMIAGLQAQSSGLIDVDGQLAGNSSRLSYVFQQPVLLPWLTVQQNIELSFTASGQVPPAGAVEQSLALVRLSDFADYLPRQLSGGMQSRVSIARALVNEPSLLLMDEPFSSLDEVSREHMNAELQRILSLKPSTVVFVTHDLTEAAFLADRVIVLTARPGAIFEQISVPFSRPRAPDLLDSAEFDLLLGQLRRSLRAAALVNATP